MRSSTVIKVLSGASALMLSATALFAGGISGGQVDDFTIAGTAGWQKGGAISNTPTAVPMNISGGGPMGGGDAYLQSLSTGTAGPGRRQVVFNTAQWAGDYNIQGVLQITMDIANFGGSPVSMRIAIQGGSNNTCYGSSAAEVIGVGGVWTPVVFELNASSMVQVLGGSCGSGDTLAQVLDNVTVLRVLAASGGAAWIGDAISSTVGYDNITASTVPVELQKFGVD